jgi:quercetin dioxygenase-like cupin family protein
MEECMELNADFSKRVAVHAARSDWVPSPMAGVDRRMLDRIGEEVARATSIVRYAPGSRFSPHTHGGGEEFLVLDGVFQDEHGEFPAGSYIRNPPTTSHTPGSVPGCTLFVKLWQFDRADRTEVRLDTTALSYRPLLERPGVKVMPLFQDQRETVRLERWEPGAVVELAVPCGAELLVLQGGFSEGGEVFEPQSWLRLPCGATLRAEAGSSGCRVWVKEGHLAHAQNVPGRLPS